MLTRIECVLFLFLYKSVTSTPHQLERSRKRCFSLNPKGSTYYAYQINCK